jgi:hypothetical protein
LNVRSFLPSMEEVLSRSLVFPAPWRFKIRGLIFEAVQSLLLAWEKNIHPLLI